MGWRKVAQVGTQGPPSDHLRRHRGVQRDEGEVPMFAVFLAALSAVAAERPPVHPIRLGTQVLLAPPASA